MNLDLTADKGELTVRDAWEGQHEVLAGGCAAGDRPSVTFFAASVSHYVLITVVIVFCGVLIFSVARAVSAALCISSPA
jgi:hypothetical protein